MPFVCAYQMNNILITFEEKQNPIGKYVKYIICLIRKLIEI